MANMNNKWMLGSHNSLTSYRVKQWYLRPFSFMGKCQKHDIYTQFSHYGARYFDIRITYDKNGNITAAHGVFHYICNINVILATLNCLANNDTYVRLILEQNSERKNQSLYDAYFRADCAKFQAKYPNLIFVGGLRKYDWVLLYDFGTKEPTLDDKYSSTTNLFTDRTYKWTDKIDDLWPWLYAKTHNRRLYKQGTNKDVLFLDFLNIK